MIYLFYFPKNIKYHTIFNLNTLNLSYCCTFIAGNIIKQLNSKVTRKTNKKQNSKCNCRSIYHNVFLRVYFFILWAWSEKCAGWPYILLPVQIVEVYGTLMPTFSTNLFFYLFFNVSTFRYYSHCNCYTLIKSNILPSRNCCILISINSNFWIGKH